MPDLPADDTRSAAYKWAWEIHKDCDQLLHQRLAAFTAAQAMTLTSFTVLTVARFGVKAADNIPPIRIVLLDVSRVFIALFGLLVAVFGWLVTYPMLKRLEALKEVLREDQIYNKHIEIVEDLPVPFLKIRFSFKIYRDVIPVWLPISEFALWIMLILFTFCGIVASY